MRRLRQSAAALLQAVPTHRKPALRRSDDPQALLATDLPLAADADAVARFVRAAEAEGWTVRPSKGWLLLDHPVPVPMTDACRVIDGEAGCCVSLLLRHPGGEACAEDVRELVKAQEAGGDRVERLCARWHGEWAARLRLHQPLPAGLLPYLLAACQPSKEEEA